MRWLWLLLTAAALFVHFGDYPLVDADEGRNAEVGREMAMTGDFVMPRLDGLPYLDKPILYFAAEAVAIDLLGPTETAARLPALLFTLATAVLVGWFARRLWGAAAGWASAVVLLSMPLVIAFSRIVIFDSALSFFIVAAIIAFWIAIEEGSSRALVLGWIAIGFGVLTKGPVAIALPLLVAIPHRILRKRLTLVTEGRAKPRLISWPAMVAFLAVVIPWVIAIEHAVPDFLHYVLVTETVQRMATKALKRTGPPWFFIPLLIGGAFPWAFAIAGAWREVKERWRDRDLLYLLLWIIVPFIFFSISQSKRPQYILPLMPAIALLAGRLLTKESSARAARRGGAIALLVAGIALIIGALAVHSTNPIVLAGLYPALLLGVTAAIAATSALFAPGPASVTASLATPILLIPLLMSPVLKATASRRSTEGLITQLRPYLQPGTEVVGLEAYTGSMSFYLRQPIRVFTADAEELTSNYLIRHYPQFANGHSNIVPLTAGLPLLDDRTHPRIVIVRDGDDLHRHQLTAHGWRLIATAPHFVAYTIAR